MCFFLQEATCHSLIQALLFIRNLGDLCQAIVHRPRVREVSYPAAWSCPCEPVRKKGKKKWHRQLRLTFGYNFHSNKLTMISWPCIRLDAKQAWEITTIGFCLESRQRTCNQEGNGGGRWRSPASQDHFQGTVWFQVQRDETCQISASYPKNSSIKASSSGSLLSITNKFSIAVWCF